VAARLFIYRRENLWAARDRPCLQDNRFSDLARPGEYAGVDPRAIFWIANALRSLCPAFALVRCRADALHGRVHFSCPAASWDAAHAGADTMAQPLQPAYTPGL